MRDLTDSNLVDPEGAAHVMDQGFTTAHFLEPGDLVFRARGSNNAAAFVQGIQERMALASPLIRIRVNTDIIDPRYLQWFINLPESQAFIGSGLQGSLVRMVSIEHLARLRIIVPPQERQRTIVELATLYAREADLLRALAELREKLGRTLIMERILDKDGGKHGD